MTIQQLEIAMSAEALFKQFSIDELKALPYVIGNWYIGSSMSKKEQDWLSKRNIKLFKKILNYYNLPNKFVLYRLTTPKRPKVKDLVGRKANLFTGNKKLQSWTTNRKFPRKMYKIAYETHGGKKDKRFITLIVGTVAKRNEVVLTTEVAVKFLRQLLSHKKDIFEKDKAEGGEGRDGVFTLSVKGTLRRLTTKFIQEQKEVILFVPSMKKRVKVLEVVYDSNAGGYQK